jgi:cytochrome c oxidase subunit IV
MSKDTDLMADLDRRGTFRAVKSKEPITFWLLVWGLLLFSLSTAIFLLISMRH